MRLTVPLYIAFLLTLVGCRARTVYLPAESSRDSVYIEKLVPVELPADTTSLYALLECDEHGKVILRSLEQEKSKNSRLTFLLDSMGKLQITSLIPAGKIYLPSVSSSSSQKELVPYPVEKEFTVWQKICIDYGGYAFAYVLLTLAFGIYKGISRIRKIK